MYGYTARFYAGVTSSGETKQVTSGKSRRFVIQHTAPPTDLTSIYLHLMSNTLTAARLTNNHPKRVQFSYQKKRYPLLQHHVPHYLTSPSWATATISWQRPRMPSHQCSGPTCKLINIADGRTGAGKASPIKRRSAMLAWRSRPI